ncbi:hypothetical protein QUF72_11160 [Desulfobacterales bacterium HSG2]|nr:hypothetical protein [Desulfobacterales bacterium HSG2]
MENINEIAALTFDWGAEDILKTANNMRGRIADAKDGSELGRLLDQGLKQIDFRTGIREQGVMSIVRLIENERKKDAEAILDAYRRDLAELGRITGRQFEKAVKTDAQRRGIRIERYRRTKDIWEAAAAEIYPKALKFGTLTLDSIDPAEWTPITSSPRWWGARNWPAAVYWWCDGMRSLLDIRDMVELEAGCQMKDFDLVAYFNLLEKHGLAEFADK